jgi:hypothetical protein
MTYRRLAREKRTVRCAMEVRKTNASAAVVMMIAARVRKRAVFGVENL